MVIEPRKLTANFTGLKKLFRLCTLVHFALASKKTYFCVKSKVRSIGHTVSRLTAHEIWSTKYRYSVLKGDIQLRCGTLLIPICEAEDVVILKSVVLMEHVHMHMEYRPSQSLSDLAKRLKGRNSIKLQQEFPELKKRYWGYHFWAIEFGCWSTCNITDKMVNTYLEHHRKPDEGSNTDFIIEK